ncbi:site-specific integrase [Nonomuraea sp. B12E4]|uniref:site-specific integrase n=1 Tax=Nonomuraea sp. B12E4 TaxID=3153564 RepID=UPI00325EA29D
MLSRRDIALREKTLWRMLYETAARAAEILALNVEDLDLEHRRAPVRSKGGATEWVFWDSGTAHLLPRLLRLPDGSSRTRGPLFLSERRPVPARRPAAGNICPHTGRAHLGYDRARVLPDIYAGLDLHQLRHSAATHLGEAEVPLQQGRPERSSSPGRQVLEVTRLPACRPPGPPPRGRTESRLGCGGRT